MSVEFEISDVIPASPDAIYEAWLDSERHTRMTGGQAKISPNIGDTFEAWDGYIQGKNLVLEYPGRILQLWRTSEFDDSDKDSLLEILFESEGDGTRVTIRHSDLPDHGIQYRQGWIDAYFVPMMAYFGGKSG
ncbi:MAG: SRPBCC domain-containing protein [Anaerolineales bacterium]|nr:SRPBCC domain-containing protein [Anaerolineales bacterium]